MQLLRPPVVPPRRACTPRAALLGPPSHPGPATACGEGSSGPTEDWTGPVSSMLISTHLPGLGGGSASGCWGPRSSCLLGTSGPLQLSSRPRPPSGPCTCLSSLCSEAQSVRSLGAQTEPRQRARQLRGLGPRDAASPLKWGSPPQTPPLPLLWHPLTSFVFQRGAAQGSTRLLAQSRMFGKKAWEGAAPQRRDSKQSQGRLRERVTLWTPTTGASDSHRAREEVGQQPGPQQGTPGA